MSEKILLGLVAVMVLALSLFWDTKTAGYEHTITAAVVIGGVGIGSLLLYYLSGVEVAVVALGVVVTMVLAAFTYSYHSGNRDAWIFVTLAVVYGLVTTGLVVYVIRKSRGPQLE